MWGREGIHLQLEETLAQLATARMVFLQSLLDVGVAGMGQEMLH